MKKAGEIIALIAAIFAVIAAFVTLMVGGLATAFNAEGGQTVVGLGWGGIGFSFLVIILSAIGIGTSTKLTSVFLIIASLGGAILGGTLVAIFMGLSFTGAILALIGTKSTKVVNSHEANKPMSKKSFIFASIIAVLFIAMCVSAYMRNYYGTDTEAAKLSYGQEVVEQPKADETRDCKSYIADLKRTDIFIKAIDQAKPFDPAIYDNVVFAESGKSLLVPSYPGELLNICIADVYYSDSSKKELVYTVSKMDDDSIHIMTKDNEAIMPTLNAKRSLDAYLAEKKNTENTANKGDVSNPTVTENASVTQMPSFDCQKATGYVEKTICEDSDLAKMDVELNDQYQLMKARVNEANIKSEQIEWLKRRNQCADKECIKSAYQIRSAEFSADSE